jgi:lipopolysaccharide biosynthesis regulator YciM
MQEKKSKDSGQQLTQSSSEERRNIFEEVAEKCLTEDERSALASVPGNLDFAARMVAAQKPAAQSAVVLKKEVSGHDPDFLSVTNNQLATLSVTKNGSAAGHSFVRSVLKEASPGNQPVMLLVTQMLAVHDATMSSAKSLGEAKTFEQLNSYGNLFNKLARTFTAQVETLGASPFR